jgi:predicted Zn-dependent protease
MKQIPDDAAERVLGMIREVMDMDAQGKTDEAALFFKPLVDEFPETSIVHSYMAWILSRGGKHREAIEHGRVAVRLSPESEMSSIMLFRVLWSAGEQGQAFDEMKRLSTYGRSEEYERMMQDWNEGKPVEEAKDGAEE